jgi:hypothetical protein
MSDLDRVIQLGRVRILTKPFELTPTPSKFEWKDYEHLDSSWEGYFDWWCKEAMQFGFLDDVLLMDEFVLTQPIVEHRQVALKTKMKWKSKQLNRGVSYTPDRVLLFRIDRPKQMQMVDTYYISDDGAMIIYNSSPGGFFKATKWGEHYVAVVDVKPAVTGMTKNSSGYTFPTKQAWMWERGMYIQKVQLMPSSKSKEYNRFLFPKTFIPDRYFKTDKNGKPRKINFPKRNISEFEHLLSQ